MIKKFSLEKTMRFAPEVANLVKQIAPKPIYSFSHIRVYPNNQCVVLASHKGWIEAGYKLQVHENIPGFDFYNDTHGFYWCNNQRYLNSRPEYIALSSHFVNIETIYTYHRAGTTYSDRFIIADAPDFSSSVSIHLPDQPNCLISFIDTYLLEVKPILERAQSERFEIVNPILGSKEKNISEIVCLPATEINQFLSIILNFKIGLSERDYLFILFSMYGFSSSEIADKFFVSKRTVENRLQKMRGYFFVSSTAKLYRILHETGAFKLYFQPFLTNFFKSFI